MTFAGQFTSTTSAAQSVTLTSSGETALSITSITAAGDFAQTNNCGASLAPAQSCTIQITFAPTALGSRIGSVTIVDNSTSTPEIIALSGLGTTFTIGTQAGGSTSATVNAGVTAVYNLTLLGTAGTTGNVAFSCSGAPAAATCAVNPTSLALSGGVPANFTVTVTTTARAGVIPLSLKFPVSGMPLYCSLLAWFAFMAMVAKKVERTRLRTGMVLACSILSAIMLIAGCGGGGGAAPVSPAPTPTPTPTPTSGTPAGTSILAVTATSGGATRILNLTLTVN